MNMYLWTYILMPELLNRTIIYILLTEEKVDVDVGMI